MSDSYYDRLRNGTLNSLTLNPDAAKRGPYEYKVTGPPAVKPSRSQPMTIHPDQTLDRYRQEYKPGQSLDPALADNPAENEGFWRRAWNDVKLGAQEGTTNLVGTVTGIQGPWSPKLASGKPLSEVAKSTVTDQDQLEKNLAEHSSKGDRIGQFVGGFIPNAARYGMAAAATGGTAAAPEGILGGILGSGMGGAAADVALYGSETNNPSVSDMAHIAANSGIWGAGFEQAEPGGEHILSPITSRLKNVATRFSTGLGDYLNRPHPEFAEPIADVMHGAIETGTGSARDETVGEGVPNLFPTDAQVQSWVNPQYAPLPGAVPQITPQQQYAATHDNPSPLPQPTETTNSDGEGAASGDFEHSCGRNSRAPCYAVGGPVLSGLRRRSIDALKGYADGGIVEMPLNDTGTALDPTSSPGPIHSGNTHLLTLDPATIRHELSSGPAAQPTRTEQLRSLYNQPDATPPSSAPGTKFDEARDWLYDKVGNLVLGKPADLSKPAYTTPSAAAPGYRPPWGGPLDIGPSTPPAYHPPAAQTDAALQHMAETGVASGLLLGGLGGGGPESMTPSNIGANAVIGGLQAFTPPSNTQQGIIMGRPDFEPLHGGQYAATAEQAATREQQVRALITGMRNQELTPQEQEQFAQARQSSPELHAVGDLMLPMEARQIIKSPQNIEAVTRMLKVIPDSYKLAGAAKMGVSKLGWYRGSSQALTDVFGDDAPRFAQMLAAMSPQTSVESNLLNALNMWKNWDAAGRPTDPAAITHIMNRSVQGGTDKSALDAWKNNTINALRAQNPMDVTLSGPKVDSFYHNLRDDVFRVTNDAWMANALGIAQDAFQGQGANVAAGNPGMTPMYAGASARLRDAALKAGMLPSQGQETVWSTAMQLYELARKNGIHPREVLERGMLTPDIIRGAPDFSTLLKDPKYAGILEQAGYGPQLQAMKPFQFPERSVPMSTAEQEQFGHIADILGETMRIRGDVSQSTKFAFPRGGLGGQPFGWGSVQVEGVPTDTGMFPEVQGLPYGTRSNYTSGLFSGLQNLRDQSRFLGAPGSGVASQPTEKVIGSYVPEGQTEAVTNPARSMGFRAPLIDTPEGPKVDPQFMANMRGYTGVQNVITAQQSSGIPVMAKNKNGTNATIRLSPKPPLKPEELKAVQEKYPGYAYAHTGPRMHVLDIGGAPLTDDMIDDMTAMLRGKKWERADNKGDYLSYAEGWKKPPGSGDVTRQMMDDVNGMTPDARNVLDQEMRDAAGKALNFYQQKARTQKWTPRQDLFNLLGTMRDKGLAGINEGLRTGAFFPALAGAFLAPHLLQHGRQNDQRDGPPAFGN